MATEVTAQLAEHPLPSPKAELKAEKKPGHRPRSQGDGGPQRELVIPGVVDFELIPETVTTPKPQTPGSYRFGRLSHHSFFSRHHPHPQHVTHIQDLTGKPVCVVRDEFSMAPLPESTPLSRCLMGMPTISSPIGDPQSNRNPQLPSEAWKRELKELSSRVATFTKENELKTQEQKEEPLREQGAKYSAETGRLIPASAQAVGRRSSRQQSHRAGRDGGVQGFLLQDQDLLGDLASPGIRFSGPVGRGHRAGPGAPLSDPADRLAERHPVLATLRSPQGERPGSRTPTDSGGSAPPSASGLHPSRKAPAPAPRSPRTTTTREAAASFQSIPEENEDPTSTQKRKARVHRESAGPADALEPGQRRKTIRGKSRELRSAEPSKAPWPAWHQGSSQVWENFGPNRFNSSS